MSHLPRSATLRSLLAAGFGTALFMTYPALAQDNTQGSSGRTIIVSGMGEASATPDLAEVSFTVLRTAKDARKALDDANQAMAALTKGMRELGAGDKDLQTTGFSIAPQIHYDQEQKPEQPQAPQITGYEVRNTLAVKIHDMTKVGTFLDRAVSLGFNQGGDLSFRLDDPQKLRSEARRKAVADAMDTARTLAEAASVKLGQIRQISMGGDDLPAPMPRAMKAMSMDSSVPVETGETRIDATVSVVFDIAD